MRTYIQNCKLIADYTTTLMVPQNSVTLLTLDMVKYFGYGKVFIAVTFYHFESMRLLV